MSELQKMELPKLALELAQILKVDLFVVGGKVRSFVMGLKNDDIDLCSKLTILEVEKFIEGTKFSLKNKNEFLGTAKIVCDDVCFDYACFREETYDEGGLRDPKEVRFVSSPKEDYLRRDFTINALYYNIKSGEILDFCGGLNDIKKKQIRCVKSPDEVLKDDGLRLLRMIRIACQLNFKIEKQTFNSAQRHIDNLKNISSAKLTEEVTKILQCETSKKNGIVKAIKNLNKLKVWRLLGLGIDKLKVNMVKKVEDKTAGLLIDLIDSDRPASVSYFLSKVLDKVEISKKTKEEVINVLSGYYDALNKIPNKVYFAKYYDNFDKIYKILVHKSKILAQKYNFFYKYINSHKIVVRVADLKVSARDLSKNFPDLPKKSYDAILNSVLADIFEGKYANDKEVILKEIEKKLKYF